MRGWDWRSYVSERFLEEADSAYCCAEVIQAAHRRGLTMVGWVKKNRLLADGRRAWDVPEARAGDPS